MRYRVKDVEVEAMQLTSRDPEGLVAFCGGKDHAWVVIYGESMVFYVQTPQGPAQLDALDWVVKHADGRLEPVSNKSFAELYEKAAGNE